tara:strand:+ start:702 stop:1091 length:390 start_codon:yes stop_codon:yes gene_type:complete
MSELNELIDNAGFDMMTSWIEPYATKLELERRNEILILDIDRLDLEKQTSNNIIEAGFIEYGDWESLKTYITEEDVKEEIEESRAFISETKLEIEEEGDDFDDYDFIFHRVLLLCEKQYVHSMTLYTKY